MLKDRITPSGGFGKRRPSPPTPSGAADRTLPAFRPKPDALPVDAIEQAVAASTAAPRLFKPKEVADILAVSERTLERWRMTGEGPQYLSLTRQTVRYTAESVAAFIGASAKANTAQV